MSTITIEGRDGRRAPSFEGELLVPVVSTYSDDKPRWVEFRLYRKDTGGYVVHRTGKSLVYHAMSTRCTTRDGVQRGSPMLARDLPEDAEPCDEERSLDWPEKLPPELEIRFEKDRNTISHVKTAAEAVKVLTWDNKTQTEVWSEPVSELLVRAQEVSEEFAAVPLNLKMTL